MKIDHTLVTLLVSLDTQDAKELERAEPDKYRAIMDYWLHLQRDDIDQLRMEHMIDSIRVQTIEGELRLLVDS